MCANIKLRTLQSYIKIYVIEPPQFRSKLLQRLYKKNPDMPLASLQPYMFYQSELKNATERFAKVDEDDDFAFIVRSNPAFNTQALQRVDQDYTLLQTIYALPPPLQSVLVLDTHDYRHFIDNLKHVLQSHSEINTEARTALATLFQCDIQDFTPTIFTSDAVAGEGPSRQFLHMDFGQLWIALHALMEDVDAKPLLCVLCNAIRLFCDNVFLDWRMAIIEDVTLDLSLDAKKFF